MSDIWIPDNEEVKSLLLIIGLATDSLLEKWPSSAEAFRQNLRIIAAQMETYEKVQKP